MFLCLAKFAERPGVVPSIGERVPTRVTQHVRIYWQDEAGPLTNSLHQSVDSIRCVGPLRSVAETRRRLSEASSEQLPATLAGIDACK